MSKLYNTYLALKENDPQTIYLFKSGIFLIAIDTDAYILSNIFHFKLGNLTNTIVKCGFPYASLDKYIKLFKLYHLNAKIIEPEHETLYNFHEYKQNQYFIELLNLIISVDINNLSISEAYKFIENIKIKANDINNLMI